MKFNDNIIKILHSYWLFLKIKKKLNSKSSFCQYLHGKSNMTNDNIFCNISIPEPCVYFPYLCFDLIRMCNQIRNMFKLANICFWTCSLIKLYLSQGGRGHCDMHSKRSGNALDHKHVRTPCQRLVN